MRLEVKKYLFDIQEAARLILQFTVGMSFQEYSEDPKTRSAVERQFMTMGEAFNRLSQVDSGIAAHASEEYQRIISFRNVLIHEYDAIQDEVVWGVVEAKLQSLLQTVEGMLSGAQE